MSDWKKYKLCDVCEKIGSGATPRGGKETYLDFGNISLIRSQNVLDFSFSKNGLAYISEEQAYDLRNVIVEEEDVLLNITGDSVARVCQVPLEILPARVNQHVAIIRGKKEILNQSFIKYYLLEPSFKRYMLGLASAGATRNALTKIMIENFEIKAPDINHQQKIASILSSLDDKIELNLQMNQTVEAIAQAIFKEWFVKFNFPSFDGELVGGLPKGWHKAKLSEFINIKHGFAFKGEFFSEVENENILLSPGNFKIGGGYNDNKFKYYNGEIKDEYILKKNDLIVTMTDLSKAGDTLGYPALVPQLGDKKLLHNQRIGKVIFNSTMSFKYYLYLIMRQDEYRHFILGSVTGSTVKHTSPTRICDYDIIVPDEKILKNFEDLAQSLFDKQQDTLVQNRTLANLRDSLLTKLMNGKIQVQE